MPIKVIDISGIAGPVKSEIGSKSNRIKDSRKRPIAHKSTITEIEGLIKKRSIIYSKAMYKIDCENLTKSETVKKIIKIYEAH